MSFRAHGVNSAGSRYLADFNGIEYRNSDGSVRYTAHTDTKLHFTRNQPLRAQSFAEFAESDWAFLDHLAGARNIGKAVWFQLQEEKMPLYGFVIDVRLMDEYWRDHAQLRAKGVKYEYGVVLHEYSSLPQRCRSNLPQSIFMAKRCWIYGEARVLGLCEHGERTCKTGSPWKPCQEQRLEDEVMANFDDTTRWGYCHRACRVRRVSMAAVADYEKALQYKTGPKVSAAYKFHMPVRSKIGELRRRRIRT